MEYAGETSGTNTIGHMRTMALVDQMALLAGSMGLGSRNGGSFLPSLEWTAENLPSSGSQRPIF